MTATNIIPDADVATVLNAVGFRSEGAVVAFAVLVGESGLNEYATNLNTHAPESVAYKSLDLGIAQFNTYWHPEIDIPMAFDAMWSIAKMLEVSNGGSDFSPWSAFDNLTFVRHIPRAYTAFAEIGVAV